MELTRGKSFRWSTILVLVAILTGLSAYVISAHFFQHLGGSLSILKEWWSVIFYGMGVTLFVSVFSILLGTSLGGVLALILSREEESLIGKITQGVINAYIYTFLAIPALVVILFLAYGEGMPRINVMGAAIIALGINLSPFAAKILVNGIRNLPSDEIKAAKAMGYKGSKLLFRFMVPLLWRNSGQPLLVQWYTTIKLTSLASIIGVQELLHQSNALIQMTNQTFEIYILMMVGYMILVIPLAWLADRIKKNDREQKA